MLHFSCPFCYTYLIVLPAKLRYTQADSFPTKNRKAAFMKKFRIPNKNAALLTIFLAALCVGSLVCLLLPSESSDTYIAEIYQNGNLLMSIPLNHRQTETRTFTIEGENGCFNEVEIRQDSIRILSADCPDKLCIRQGFIHNSRLPLTCLPNRLVIRLRPVSDDESRGWTPDTVTY